MRKVHRRLDAVYAQIPTVECKGLCVEACGPIGLTPAEWDRVAELSGIEPGIDADLTCTLLQNGRCAGYAARPFICRIWGVEETMPCPFGCEPSRVLSKAEGHRILNLVDKASGRKGILLTIEPRKK